MAFACLDEDEDVNGYVTKEERNSLQKRFYQSRLSSLSEEETVLWLVDPKCVSADLSKYRGVIEGSNLNGLALWDVGIKDPSLLMSEVGITR